MEITLADQTWLFLASIALGALLGAVYDLGRVARLAFRHSVWVVLVEDVLFSIICAAATFLFVLSADEGQLRLFVLIGELIGFVLYRFTIGALVMRVAKGVIEALRRIFAWLNRMFVAPVVRLFLYLCNVFCISATNTSKHIKNRAENSKLHLKPCKRLLYNLAKWPFRRKNRKLPLDRNGRMNEK